jgi:hypothetical protein
MTNFKGGNITEYLILEEIYAIGKMKLLDDMEISPLSETPNGVSFWMLCCRHVQLLGDLY